MKRIIIIIALSFLTANLFGQNTTTEYGLKTGINYSKYTPNIEFNGIEVVDFNGKFGFFVGGFVNFDFSDILKLQPELLFALQGTNTSQEIELRFSPDQEPVVGELKSRVTESTISLPIMLQIYPTEKFYIEIGPQFGYIVNRKEKVTDDPFTEFGSPFGVSEDCPNCDKFDLGASLGIGYNFTSLIGISTRYYAGLIERNNTIKSSVINLGINYKL
ncbi:porin family protein [Aequorivita xiaoshiensis]|uniref:PorT family protein n=1 Tax=Aequorivita xiaoshiensis TaxID=2874476 RepID=A0A9X1R4L1_9FLAO|nr:porin family protein [Aequorivita xiaoshiensis]MCG2432184.1 PorT family protein [Aequorivita xiaoshiensis]